MSTNDFGSALGDALRKNDCDPEGNNSFLLAAMIRSNQPFDWLEWQRYQKRVNIQNLGV